jgi:hypothetical protein
MLMAAAPRSSRDNASRRTAGHTSHSLPAPAPSPLLLPVPGALPCAPAAAAVSLGGKLGAFARSVNTARRACSTCRSADRPTGPLAAAAAAAAVAAAVAAPAAAEGGCICSRRCLKVRRCHRAWMMTLRKQLYCPSSLRNPRTNLSDVSTSRGPCAERQSMAQSSTAQKRTARHNTESVHRLVNPHPSMFAEWYLQSHCAARHATTPPPAVNNVQAMPPPPLHSRCMSLL